MIAADWLFPTHIDILSYMLLKYCCGFLFLLVFPLAVLICHPEVPIFLTETMNWGKFSYSHHSLSGLERDCEDIPGIRG